MPVVPRPVSVAVRSEFRFRSEQKARTSCFRFCRVLRREAVHVRRQFEVEVADAFGVVCRQEDFDAVVDIRPFWMVIALNQFTVSRQGMHYMVGLNIHPMGVMSTWLPEMAGFQNLICTI